MKGNKGFTLIELLAVIIIMTVILGIGIPSVVRIIQNKGNDQYNVQEKMVEKAIDLYVDRYKARYKNKDVGCYIIDYSELKNEGLITEQDLTCTGNIKIERIDETNSFKKEIHLNCVDKSNRSIKTNEPFSSSECLVNNEASDDMDVPVIDGGNNSWTTNNVTISITDANTSEYNYQYYSSTDPVLPSINPTPAPQPVNGTSVTIGTQGTTYVWFRAVSKTDSNKVSDWSNRQEIHIDKNKPQVPKILADDGVASNGTHKTDFVLEFDGGNSPSGNVYYAGTTNTSNLTEVPYGYINISLENTANGTTYYVKACSKINLSNCSDAAMYIIKK